MGNNYHDIELFGILSAPRHTALKKRIPSGICQFNELKKSLLNRDKPPPAQEVYSELLNVLNKTSADCICFNGSSYSLLIKVLFSRCRAPPEQGFLTEILEDTEEKPCGRKIMDKMKQKHCRTNLLHTYPWRFSAGGINISCRP